MDSDGDGMIDEMTGHGTYVAGLIHLVAPQARILPLRVLDGDGIGDMWTMAKATFYAIDRRVEVINVSISSTYKSQAIEDAADEAESLGIVLVAAAGNCNQQDPAEYPGMLGNEVIGVAATDDLDVKGAFSNYSEDLALSAPGVTALRSGAPDPARAIISTMPGGQFAYWQGTSMAAPLVAGAAALIRSQQPGLPLSISTYNLVRGRLTSTAVNIAPMNPGYAGVLGAGRLDVAAAVALGPPTPALGDLNGDGSVDVVDLTAVIVGWGPCPGPPDPCVKDIDNDGMVGVADLVLVVLNWG
jgi:subtilisin family serine protease